MTKAVLLLSDCRPGPSWGLRLRNLYLFHVNEKAIRACTAAPRVVWSRPFWFWGVQVLRHHLGVNKTEHGNLARVDGFIFRFMTFGFNLGVCWNHEEGSRFDAQLVVCYNPFGYFTINDAFVYKGWVRASLGKRTVDWRFGQTGYTKWALRNLPKGPRSSKASK